MIDVIELRQGLGEVAKLPLPVRVAYRIAKTIEKVQAEGRRYDALRQKLFEKHGERNGDRLEVPREKLDAFGLELNELLLLEVELEIEPVVTIDELGDVKVAPADLARIGRLIKDA